MLFSINENTIHDACAVEYIKELQNKYSFKSV